MLTGLPISSMNLLFSSIGRRGYIADYFRRHLAERDRIIGTSNTRWTPGFRACDLAVLMPDIASPSYIATLIRLCQEQHIAGILSFYDPDIDVLSHNLDRFRAIGVTPILPSAAVNDIGFDKKTTQEFLVQHSFCAPQTFASLDDAVKAIDSNRIGFPVIVKPRYGFASRHLFRAHSVEELAVFHRYVPNMIIQEALVGQEYHLDICNDMDGRVLQVAPKKKVAMRAGETDQAEVATEDGLIDLGLRLGRELGRLGHVGPLDVDVFLVHGEWYVLEINPRFGGGYPFSHLAGADFPGFIVKMLRGEHPTPQLDKLDDSLMMMKDYLISGCSQQSFLARILDYRDRQSTSSLKSTTIMP